MVGLAAHGAQGFLLDDVAGFGRGIVPLDGADDFALLRGFGGVLLVRDAQAITARERQAQQDAAGQEALGQPDHFAPPSLLGVFWCRMRAAMNRMAAHFTQPSGR